MRNLADIVVHYLCLMLFCPDEIIDSDFSVRETESFPELLCGLNVDEKNALSAAAQRAVDAMKAPPDEYGYKAPVNKDQLGFLETLASGEAYEFWRERYGLP